MAPDSKCDDIFEGFTEIDVVGAQKHYAICMENEENLSDINVISDFDWEWCIADKFNLEQRQHLWWWADIGMELSIFRNQYWHI